MTSLTAKSIGADLIWFGIGIRHVLRDLVQTSQGCSLVALCAALTQAHSISASALVIHEIAKICGGPEIPLPSLEQWEIHVGTAAPIFENTTFGLHLGQISKVGTQSRRTPVFRPADLAKTLLSIGQVAHESLQTFSIRGDQRCSWIATWADFVLGLRIVVRDARGIIVYENHNTNETSTQLHIDFDPDEVCEGVLSSYNINEHITGHEYMSSSKSLRIEPCKRGLQYKCSTDNSVAHPLRSTLRFIRPFFARRMECSGSQVSHPRRIEPEKANSGDLYSQMCMLLLKQDDEYQDRDNSRICEIQ